jgi:hypothetical protein
MSNEAQTQPAADDPLPWLLTLEMARQRGDFEKAAVAKRELAKLGVKVTYSPAKAVKNGR